MPTLPARNNNIVCKKLMSKWDWTLKRRIRFHLRRVIRHRPALYLPITRLRPRPFMMLNGIKMIHTGVVGEDTDIVIEGPHRCGNTFAVVAFQLAQQQPLEIAHHLHAEAQIIQGVALKIPVILLLRHPDDVVVSTAASFGFPIKQALRYYITFYERVLPYLDHVVVADFDTVTSDFGRAIEAVNTRFGSHFGVFQHTQENVDRCFQIIDEFYQRTAPEPERTVARPSEQRHKTKDMLRAEYFSLKYADQRAQAEKLYASLSQKEYAMT